MLNRYTGGIVSNAVNGLSFPVTTVEYLVVAGGGRCKHRGDALCDALGRFYFATGGPTWTASDGWADAAAGTATDFCDFSGVTCGSGSDWALEIVNNNLTGALPATLGACMFSTG
jgi:hypothetical protein